MREWEKRGKRGKKVMVKKVIKREGKLEEGTKESEEKRGKGGEDPNSLRHWIRRTLRGLCDS